jgi:hypothetical protein
MVRTRRLSMTGALIVCLVATQWNGTLFASEEKDSSRELSPALAVDEGQTVATDVSSVLPAFTEQSRFALKDESFTIGPITEAIRHSQATSALAPDQFSTFATQIYRGQPQPIRRSRDGSIAAIVIGAVASITGAAILVYANRPECGDHQFGTGCGYGTKVVGGAVLSGGIVGLTIGALTWR